MADLGVQGKALEAALVNEAGDLETATRSILVRQGNALKQSVQAQKQKGFLKGRNSQQSRGFFGSRAVKVIDLPTDSARGYGPAVYVRVGPPFLEAFQEGATISPIGEYLITLTKDGARLGFTRINKGNPWKQVYEINKKDFGLIKVNNGFDITFKTTSGEVFVVYTFRKQVKEKKKISFYEEAERIAQSLPEEILQELDK